MDDDRQRAWQACNEFGWFPSAGGPQSPFHPLAGTLGVDYYRQLCEDTFAAAGLSSSSSSSSSSGGGGGGVLFSSSSPSSLWTVSTELTNECYGAKALGASRVLLPSGSLDPWRALALTEPLLPLQRALNVTPLVIDGATHCADMWAASTTSNVDGSEEGRQSGRQPRPQQQQQLAQLEQEAEEVGRGAGASVRAAQAEIAATVAAWLQPSQHAAVLKN